MSQYASTPDSAHTSINPYLLQVPNDFSHSTDDSLLDSTAAAFLTDDAFLAVPSTGIEGKLWASITIPGQYAYSNMVALDFDDGLEQLNQIGRAEKLSVSRLMSIILKHHSGKCWEAFWNTLASAAFVHVLELCSRVCSELDHKPSDIHLGEASFISEDCLKEFSDALNQTVPPYGWQGGTHLNGQLQFLLLDLSISLKILKINMPSLVQRDPQALDTYRRVEEHLRATIMTKGMSLGELIGVEAAELMTSLGRVSALPSSSLSDHGPLSSEVEQDGTEKDHANESGADSDDRSSTPELSQAINTSDSSIYIILDDDSCDDRSPTPLPLRQKPGSPPHNDRSAIKTRKAKAKKPGVKKAAFKVQRDDGKLSTDQERHKVSSSFRNLDRQARRVDEYEFGPNIDAIA